MGRTERELRRKQKGWHTLFFGLVLLPMFVVFPYIRAVNNPNEYVRVFTVMSLVEEGTFRVDEQVATFGWVNDMAKVQGKDDGKDHYYMVKAPGIIYPALPGYFVFSKIIAPILGKKYPGVYGGHWQPTPGATVNPSTQEDKLWWLRMATWAMRLSASQIPCFLFLLWFEKYLRDFTSDALIRYGAVAAAGLGTNYLAYTHMYASHSQYAAVAFIAFATIEREARLSRGDILKMRPSKALLAGFCTSACVTLEYHALFMTVVMSLFAFFTFWRPFSAVLWITGLRKYIPLGTSVNPTRLLAFAFGGLLNIPHMMYFHWTAYGNAFTPGHQKLETANFAAEHKMGLWGIMVPKWEHIAALAVDPGFGFFGMSPYMWLGLLGVPLIVLSPFGPPSRRTHLRWISVVWLLCMSVCIGVNAGFVEWRAGWTVGPRYLVVCAPFFAFGAVVALERIAQRNRLRRALARGVGGGLALAGIISIGTVGLVYDTLPENIMRPFAQFSFPMARIGYLPHHVFEWIGWDSNAPWYIACLAMLVTPFVAAALPLRNEKLGETIIRYSAFALMACAGLGPALSPPDDHSELFRLSQPVAGLGPIMEPTGRDRITRYREESERYNLRGPGPCILYRLSNLEHTAGQEVRARSDEQKAMSVVPRAACPRFWF